MKYRFAVSLEIPKGATVHDVREYINDSVKTMRGCYSLEDPIFKLDADSVRVALAQREKKKSSTPRKGIFGWLHQKES